MENIIIQAFKDDPMISEVTKYDIVIDNYGDFVAVVENRGNNFVIKINLDKTMFMYEEVDDFDALIRFLVKHELGHIHLGHLLIDPVDVEVNGTVVHLDPVEDAELLNLAADSIINSKIPEAQMLKDYMVPPEVWVTDPDKVKPGSFVGPTQLLENPTTETLAAFLKFLKTERRNKGA